MSVIDDNEMNHDSMRRSHRGGRSRTGNYYVPEVTLSIIRLDYVTVPAVSRR